ncbi:hypothetical protein GCM10011583_60260 [Streptomyces camponoticapitis]|uniref:Major facilitator superfamily (MFS) profile domain-containing protein n=1 Tax=Streptomyces camponoticapitis TaxID=1616125 RepID=A0ABQ2ESV5_9ACTN|nr:hypothetical protein GCM10011583_60260 [Streptomyces camponoticapitis]
MARFIPLARAELFRCLLTLYNRSGGALNEPSGGIAPARSFWTVAIALGALMAFGTVPTPLWPLFAGRDGFGSTMVTVAFAAMVVGAAAGFLLLGHLSDRLGRRRIIVPALLTSALAALLLVTWHGVTGLLVARVVTGIGTGLMASTATAYLSDLYSRAHPKRTGSPVPGAVAAGRRELRRAWPWDHWLPGCWPSGPQRP